jgi:hypothetical protein
LPYSEAATALSGALFTMAAALALGRVATRRLNVPVSIVFGTGAAILHLFVFALMVVGQARPVALAVVAACSLFLLVPRYRARVSLRLPPWWVLGTIAPFAVLYVTNALAPEVQADANTYHLMPAIEAARTGGFSREFTFYDRLPHATELLFVPAYALGSVSAAKLVHLGFLFWTLPLMIAIARQLRLPDPTGAAAAALYFVTPVVGVSASSAFNDAALVFFILATVWTLLTLRERHSRALALIAGVFAGMCYAVKMNGGIAIVVAGLFLVVLGRWRASWTFALGVAAMAGPWLLRNSIETSNPVAPFFNAAFPNPYFYVEPERQLGEALRSYGVPFAQRFWEVIAGPRLHGAIGPMFLLAPLTLLAWRRRSIRDLWLLATVFSVGWWLNAGARFLLPALPFLALGMASLFPRVLLVPAHAILSWPWLLGAYSPPTWRLMEFPWRVAAGLESTDKYLTRVSGDYRLARFVEKHTPKDARIFDLVGLHRAFMDRRILGSWQTAEGYRLTSALELGRGGSLDEWRASFEPRLVGAVRIQQRAPEAANWSINELVLAQGGERVTNSSEWRLYASRNSWDLPLAFDRSGTSRWSTWQRSHPGDFVRVEFGRFVMLDGVSVLALTYESDVKPSIEIKTPGGAWSEVHPVHRPAAALRLRVDATRLLARSGVTHIVTAASRQGIGALGYSLANEADDWALEVVGNLDVIYVLRVPQIP